MLVKLLYSALLAVVALAATGELVRIWTDRRLYIGPFDYASAEGDAQAKGKTFGVQVGLAHTLIFRQLQDYNRRGEGGTSDATYNIGADEQLAAFKDKLEDLALTYQNVNIGQLLSGLRKSLSQPNEVSGAVTKVDGRLWAKVSWPGAPAIGGKAEPSFLTDMREDDASAARQVACGIAWAQVAGRSPAIADMGRVRFCQWAEALGVYSALKAKPSDTAAQDIAQRRDDLKRMAATGVRFPDIYRLRADLTDLLPAADRLALLVDAQNDRLTYALLTDPTIQKLHPDERRLVAFALARPAIRIEDGQLADVRDNWRSILEPHGDAIKRVAAAIGTLRRGDEHFRATAFRVRHDLVVTVDFALNDVKPPAGAETAYHTAGADARIAGLVFCAGDDALAGCPANERLAVQEVVLESGPDSRIVVLRIGDTTPAEPLQLRDTARPADTLVDQYAYIVAYPVDAPMLPPAFRHALLGGKPGIKRLLPGRTLTLEHDGADAQKTSTITTDINTSAGTAGAPLVDLLTGRVIGVHVGGRFDEKKGKFTFAEMITPEFAARLQTVLQSR
jgi:hypothetical protein